MPDTLVETLDPLPILVEAPILDRPGWIPSEIRENWNPDPYAYQTEEESMPAGGLQGQLLAYIMEVVRHVLYTKGLMLLLDVFMLYRDQNNIKQRIGPDLLLMPYRFPPPSAYDLDHEPPPLCVIEVTSSDSHTKDLQTNVPFYIGLGIPTYLAIDAITPRGQLRERIELHLWRSVNGQPRPMLPDREGWLILPEMGLKIKTIGQRIMFSDAVTNKVLFDSSHLLAALAEERQTQQKVNQALLAERQARQEDRQNVALAMWHKGLAIEMIAEVTGLSETELALLIKENRGD